MNKILLCGAGGFLGKNISERLSTSYEIVLFDRKLGIEKHFLSGPIDFVINCAGEVKDVSKMVSANLDFAKELLLISHKYNVKKFVHIGSSSELGNTNLPRSESDPCNPATLYQGTKAAATMIIQGFAGQFDFDACISRPFTITGKYLQSNRFIPSLYDAFINNKQFDLYKGTHDYLDAADFIDGIQKILESHKNITKGQIFHFGSGISTSNEQVVEIFQKIVRSELNIIRHNERYHNYDIDNWQADTHKTSEVLNWKPKISLEQSINEYVNWRWFEKDLG